MTARRQAPPRPTPAELEILRSLWTHGPSTVREVRERIDAARPTRYTTALKLMQIMTDKGLLRRDESARAHVYAAAVRKEDTQAALVRDLVDRGFGGSASQLVLHALSARRLPAGELQRIRALIDELEKGAR